MKLVSDPNTFTCLIIEIGVGGLRGGMRKDPKPRTLREMIQAGENHLPPEELSRKPSADASKPSPHGEAEVMVSEICDSILHRLNEPEQPRRNEEHRRTKHDANPQ